MRKFSSHGDGAFLCEGFASAGAGIVFEKDVMVWHPETIAIGQNVYVGHRAMLKGHPAGKMKIGNDVWIGQNAFLHSAGNITLGNEVGIGPGVMIFTSFHEERGRETSILDAPLGFKPVTVEDGADIGIGAVILPGVTVGKGAQIGAGAVVTRDVPPYAVAAGNPARVLRMRP